ncbi:hypothetical protein PTTW11_01342 [Pyrenophora teres f. teres]|uniref:Uncharacterized protein n=1 Tax=Pyrenophora teres f. teres TaxID=97479 RepID=A0A6S6VQG3_9PLEO|nr:hypothetical protein PTTW11_01342 [Pyrenophora teres f. teres]
MLPGKPVRRPGLGLPLIVLECLFAVLRLLSSATSNKEGSLLDAGRMARGYWAPQACNDMALHEQGEVSDSQTCQKSVSSPLTDCSA